MNSNRYIPTYTYSIHPIQSNVMASTSRAATTAHKLPKLLSLLPADGRGALVRPVSAPGVVYRITRTKLKFIPSPSSTSTSIADGQGAEELGVSGRVWGLKFSNGQSSLALALLFGKTPN